MKFFIILVTLVSSYIALSDVLPNISVEGDVKAVSADVKLQKQAILPDELALEKSWKEAKKKFDKKLEESRNPKPIIKPVPSKPKPKLHTLNIAGIEYNLLAVVNAGEVPYILLKSQTKPLKKVEVNMDIAPSVTLKEVRYDRILVALGENMKEFKLFERKKS